jgi:hypothetical protein
MDCKRTVDSATQEPPRHPCPVPLDSRFRAPCGKGYRRVMRQKERAPNRFQNRATGFWIGQRQARPCLPQQAPQPVRVTNSAKETSANIGQIEYGSGTPFCWDLAGRKGFGSARAFRGVGSLLGHLGAASQARDPAVNWQRPPLLQRNRGHAPNGARHLFPADRGVDFGGVKARPV